MRYLSPRASQRVDKVLAAKTDNFAELVHVAGLSPATDFQNTCLRSIDFNGSDLSGFDFSGTVFENCDFVGCSMAGATFTGAEFKSCVGGDDEVDHALPDGAPHELDEEQYDQALDRYETLPLSQQLLAEGRHPVLVFGGPAAGKTVLIQALLQCLRSAPHAYVSPHQLHAPEPEMATWTSHFEDERRFARTTRFSVAPVDIVLRDSEEPTKLAFFDAPGEWLTPRGKRHIADEYIEVLEHYPNPISLIYLLPVDEGDTYTAEAYQESAILAIKQYDYIRKFRSEDHHLVLLAKWDRRQHMLDPARKASPSASVVGQVMGEQYLQFWGHLSGLAGLETVAVAAFSVRDPSLERDLFPPRLMPDNLFAKAVLNWLSENTVDPHRYFKSKRGLRIFPDSPSISLKPSPFRNLLDFFTSR